MSRTALKRLLILLLVVSVLSALVGGAVIYRSVVVERTLTAKRSEGLRLVEQGEHTTALPLLTAYVASVKDDPEALIAFAACRIRSPLPNGKHISAALAAASLANQVAPQNPDPLEFMIEVYSRIQLDGRLVRKTELLDTCERLLAIDPGNELALASRVPALLEFERFDEATLAADAYIALHPDSLDAYESKARVLNATGSSSSEVDAYLRSPGIAARLADLAAYHILAVRSAAAAALASELDDDRRAAYGRALESARNAASKVPATTSDALVLTEIVRRIGVAMQDDAVIAEADAVVDHIAASELGDAFTAAASRRAWWQLRDARALELASRIGPSSEDDGATGWRDFLDTEHAQSGSPPPHDSAAAAYWRGAREALGMLREGIATKPILEHLGKIERVAQELDERPGLRDHADLLAVLRARAYLDSHQFLSATEVLRGVAWESNARERARIGVMLTDLYLRRGNTEQAERTIAELRRRGIDPDGLRFVMDRMVDRTLAETATEAGLAEALALLASSERRLDEQPENADLLATHTRLLLLAGRTPEAIDAVNRLIRAGAPENPSDLEVLARLLVDSRPDLARQILELWPDDRPVPIPVVVARAEITARSEGSQAAWSLFLEAGVEDRDAPLELAIEGARFLERHALPGALDLYRRISDRFDASPAAQAAVLESPLVRNDQATLRDAIGRLRETTGEDAIEWKRAALRADLATLDELPEGTRAPRLAQITLALQELSDRVPDDPVLHRLLALARDRADEPEQALRSLRRAARIDPTVYPELVRLGQRAGQPDEGGADLDAFALIDRRTLSPPLLRERASLLENAGKLEMALEDRRYLASTGRARDLTALALTLSVRGRTEEARSLALTITASPDANASEVVDGLMARVWTSIARWSDEPTDAEHAIECLSAVREADGARSLDLEREIASMEQIAGRPTDAIRRLEDLLETHPDDFWTRNNLALLLATDNEQPARAVTLARRALDMASAAGLPERGIGTMRHSLGVALRANQEPEAAEAELRAAVAETDRSSEPLTDLCELLIERGESDEARELARLLPSADSLPRALASRVRKIRTDLGG